MSDYSGFEVSKADSKKIEAWIEKQGPRTIGTIGGRYSYCFTPTSLGVVFKVLDALTGAELDLTDYEGW